MTRPKKRTPIFDKGFEKDLARARTRGLVSRILALVSSACEDHASGLGKPKPLTDDWAGFWARRVNKKDRVVYRPTNGEIEFHQALGHYSDH